MLVAGPARRNWQSGTFPSPFGSNVTTWYTATAQLSKHRRTHEIEKILEKPPEVGVVGRQLLEQGTSVLLKRYAVRKAWLRSIWVEI